MGEQRDETENEAKHNRLRSWSNVLATKKREREGGKKYSRGSEIKRDQIDSQEQRSESYIGLRR